MSARKRAHAQRSGAAHGAGRDLKPAWPGDPEGLTAAGVDFEALAYVLANTCRWGGRTRQYHSLAAHAAIASEEIESLDGLGDEERRRLALHALLAVAPSAWLPGEHGSSQRATERSRRVAAGIQRAVREAAGLEPELAEEHTELLRFVFRMTVAAERRDLMDAGTGEGAAVAFPPLKRRLRPVGPGRAARLWLNRFRALAGPAGDAGAGRAAAPEATDEETNDGVSMQVREGDDGRRAA